MTHCLTKCLRGLSSRVAVLLLRLPRGHLEDFVAGSTGLVVSSNNTRRKPRPEEFYQPK